MGFPYMLVGYMRVSTDNDRQVLDLQRDALLSVGVDERHLFDDHVSGSQRRSPRAWQKRSPSFGRAIVWLSGSWIASAGRCRIF